MSTFLESLQAETKSTGVEIEIGGNTFLVVDTVQRVKTRLSVKGQELAKEKFGPNKAVWSKQNLTKEEKKVLRETISRAVPESEVESTMKVISNRYKLEVYSFMWDYVSARIYTEIIRNPDGTKIYDSEEQREKINEALEANPEAMEKINQAFDQIQQKKSQKTRTKEPLTE